jgi:hypothetical protein
MQEQCQCPLRQRAERLERQFGFLFKDLGPCGANAADCRVAAAKRQDAVCAVAIVVNSTPVERRRTALSR